jgi:hypothetical protein
MSHVSRPFVEKSIFLLLAANLIAGLFIFRHFGLSWDEPLFYDYGDALGYAYSPREWFSGQFDVDNSYGASGDDHKTRGPAYLILARGPVSLLKALSLDLAAAWHLVNFIFSQLGVYFLYRLAARWVRQPAALAATALFALQPMLWGHFYINPKDMPFLTFFLASVCLGFEMVDKLLEPQGAKLSNVLLPGVVLGITTSIRVLGPLAGLLVLLYFASKVLQTKDRRDTTTISALVISYGVLAVLTMFLTWPYLWEQPFHRFFEVFRLMSDNPTSLSVLFGGEVYRAGELPRRYLPIMLAITLTEPVWVLFLIGVLLGYWKVLRGRNPDRMINTIGLTLILLWFVIPAAYVLIRKPAMYDGIRHFLFILPPIFLFSGFAFEYLSERIPSKWLYAGIVGALLLPGIVSMVRLHPYEYAYYNSFIGGTQGAFRSFETDYWLTCYKDAMEALNEAIDEPTQLFVHREAYIAEYYAHSGISVHDLRGAVSDVQSGDFILVNTRTNEDRRVFRDASPVIQLARDGALFCTIKRIP